MAKLIQCGDLILDRDQLIGAEFGMHGPQRRLVVYLGSTNYGQSVKLELMGKAAEEAWKTLAGALPKVES